MTRFKDENDLQSDYEGREEMDQFCRNHRNFGLWAKLELKRAERYCEFLSLLVLDFSSLSKFARMGAVRSYCRIETLLEDIEKRICDRRSRIVRETDVVSGVANHRLLLLLPETPKEGAVVLAKRLKDDLKNIISSSLKTPPGWQLSMDILSYPDRKGKERLMGFIGELTQS